MASEILGAKLLAPFFGTSLYVWTAILAFTVLGLAVGYAVGGRWASGRVTPRHLAFIMAISAALVLAMPIMAAVAMDLGAEMDLIPGICLGALLLVVPPLVTFGLVGPMMVRLLSSRGGGTSDVAGKVYFVSTLGGLVGTFLFGYMVIPILGLTAASRIIAAALVVGAGFCFRYRAPAGRDAEDIREPTPAPAARRSAGGLLNAPKATLTNREIILFTIIEGFAVMAVELMAARMIAPYFGASLYPWVAVIGITLLSLAVGYFLGGRVRMVFRGMPTAYWILLAAGIGMIFMHYVSHRFTMAFADQDLRIAVVLVSFLLIFPPVVLLGMLPTLLIRLKARAGAWGLATGQVFSISALSGLLALPVFGFWIIPAFGLGIPSMILGLLVAAWAIVKFTVARQWFALALFPLLWLSYTLRMEGSSTENVSIQYCAEGLLGQVLVADIHNTPEGRPINQRIMFINRIGQTMIDIGSNTSLFPYIPFMSSLGSHFPAGSGALLLGLGGGSVANSLQTGGGFKVDAVEFDERIAQAARDYFSLNPSVRVIIDDARHYLETSKSRYDLILFDVFKGDHFPAHVMSLEAFLKAKTLLNEGGILVINFNGYLSEQAGRPARSMVATLRAAGFKVEILPTPGPEDQRNLLFIAAPAESLPGFKDLRNPLLHFGQPVDIDSMMVDMEILDMRDALVFDDDHPTLERLNLIASRQWRGSYNRTLTSYFLKNGIPLYR